MWQTAFQMAVGEEGHLSHSRGSRTGVGSAPEVRMWPRPVLCGWARAEAGTGNAAALDDAGL